jgi:hypothetical protein
MAFIIEFEPLLVLLDFILVQCKAKLKNSSQQVSP